MPSWKVLYLHGSSTTTKTVKAKRVNWNEKTVAFYGEEDELRAAFAVTSVIRVTRLGEDAND